MPATVTLHDWTSLLQPGRYLTDEIINALVIKWQIGHSHVQLLNTFFYSKVNTDDNQTTEWRNLLRWFKVSPRIF